VDALRAGRRANPRPGSPRRLRGHPSYSGRFVGRGPSGVAPRAEGGSPNHEEDRHDRNARQHSGHLITLLFW
jgi:hypothetical protein